PADEDRLVAASRAAVPAGTGGSERAVRSAGGLLGQWAVWASRAVELLERARECRTAGRGALELLAEGAQLTDANGAIFDTRHGFAGCIPGIHEVLRGQGLLAGRWCLDPDEELSRSEERRVGREGRAGGE